MAKWTVMDGSKANFPDWAMAYGVTRTHPIKLYKWCMQVLVHAAEHHSVTISLLPPRSTNIVSTAVLDLASYTGN
jgi:hypothetical protein